MKPSQPADVAPRGRTGPDDLLLTRRALRGEPAAVDELLGRLSCIPRFVNRLDRKLGCGLSTSSLEDVVQQVYVAVLPRLRDFAGTAALESWVFDFCRNCLRAEARRRSPGGGRVKPVDPEDLQRHADPRHGDPPAAVEAREGLELLRQELERLAEDERQVVELRHLHGVSFEQIARQLGLSASTVKDRCYRAMLRIKERLQRRDVDV